MIGFDIRSVHTEDYKAIEKLNSKLNNTKLKEIKGDKNCIAYAAQLNDDVIGYAIFHIFNKKDYKRGIDIDDVFTLFKKYELKVGWCEALKKNSKNDSKENSKETILRKIVKTTEFNYKGGMYYY